MNDLNQLKKTKQNETKCTHAPLKKRQDRCDGEAVPVPRDAHAPEP
jgi:hypothetical protein